MKICYLNLPWEEEGRRGIRAGCRFPNLQAKNTNSYVPFPFLLAYGASYAESQGAQALCIDGVAERCSVASVAERVRNFAPQLIVVEISTTSLARDLTTLAELRQTCPSAKTAIYGSHVDVRPMDGLSSEAVDFVIRGEPEITSVELARALVTGSDFGEIDGLVYLNGSGQPVETSRRPLIPDIDALPYPMRRNMPLEHYNVPGFPAPVVFMYGSRGCPFKCNFCLWPQTMLRGNFRARNGRKIVEEMAWVLENYPQTKSFFFDDDTFNLGRVRCLDFADEMKRRGMKIPWGMNARADNWDRELMERLVETGLFTLRIGVESGDPEVLKRTHKDITLEQVVSTLEMAHSLGIRNHVSFVIGLVGETEESVDRTIRFIKSLPVDSVQFSVAVPFPGTDFYRDVEAAGHLETRDWRKFNGFEDVVVRTDSMSAAAIKRAVVRARRSVYFSPRFVFQRLRYVRDLRDLGAITRKAWRLLVPNTRSVSQGPSLSRAID
jgi:radical SAM superfamily enzyme YgiQ (UPF0313 family)